MPNFAVALREEITRLARREIRIQLSGLKKASVQSRSDVAELKRRIAKLQAEVARLVRQQPKEVPILTEGEAQSMRFNAKGLRSHRQRVGMSAVDYGRLIGVSGQSIYTWERGNTRPRKSQMGALKSVRSLGKREAVTRLGREVKRGTNGKSKSV